MSVDIVISHYNENLEWIKNLPDNQIRHIFIYSKYESSQDHSGIRLVNKNKQFENPDYFTQLHNKIKYQHVKNIGRESETYLRYCYEEYDNIPDHSIFLQGEPHLTMDDINILIKDFSDKKYTYSQNYQMYDGNDGTFLGGHLHDWYGKTDRSEFNFFTWSRNYIDPELYMYNLRAYYGACFGVSKAHILSRKRNYYSSLREKEFNKRNPEAAHFCERLWFYLFNCHKT